MSGDAVNNRASRTIHRHWSPVATRQKMVGDSLTYGVAGAPLLDHCNCWFTAIVNVGGQYRRTTPNIYF